MRNRALPILLIAAFLLAALWLGRLCRSNSQTSFLARHPGAEWIVYPKPPVPYLQAVAELPAVFRRSFTLDRAPASVTLALRACRRAEVSINGQPLAFARSPQPGEWKKVLEAEIQPLLRTGENEIRITVRNNVGPPALWLRINGAGIDLRSDKSWEVSYAGAVWRPAQLAAEPAVVAAGNPLRSATIGWAKIWQRWPTLALLLLISLLLVVGGRWWSARLARESRGRWLWLSDRPTLGLIGICLLWIALVTHNLDLIPRSVGFDTDGHLDYIRWIQTHTRLPAADAGWETHQPPLYYLLSAITLSCFGMTPDTPAGLAVLRVLGLGIGLVHLIFIWLSLRLLFPGQSGRQLVGLVFAGFLPMQLYLTHYVTNEILVACLISATLYLGIRLMQAPGATWRLYTLLGACLGLALLTKVTAYIAVPFALAALIFHACGWREGGWRRWAFPALALLVCGAVCGWHYLRVWTQFGHPLFAQTRWAFGISWWQDPGYRTAAYFGRVGRCIVDPFFSGTVGFGDGLYSTLWGDGLVGGVSAWLFRPPWNYELMRAGYWLALLPMALLMVGLGLALWKTFREPRPLWVGLTGFSFLILLALIHLNLMVPSYAVAKSFYGLAGMLAWSALAAAGWGLVQKWKRVEIVAATTLAFWALNSYASFWIDRGSARTQAVVGRSLVRSGLEAQGTETLTQALRIDPQHLAARSFLCQALMRQGKTAEAAALAEETVRLYPGPAQGHLDLANVLEAQKQLLAAIEQTRLALDGEPDNPDARLALASRLLKAGAYPGAIEASREALRLSPSDPENHLILGCASAYLARNESGSKGGQLTEQGIEHLRLALELSPNYAAALNSLAWIRATHPEPRVRDGEEALRLAQRACVLTSYRNPDMLGTLAAAYAETGRYAEAIRTVEQGIELASKLGAGQALATQQHLLALFNKQQPYRDSGNGQ